MITTAQLSGIQTSVGGARIHCMQGYAYKRRRADMHSITIIFSYICTSLKFLIIKKSHQQQETKPLVEAKTAQYVHDIELHFT